MTERQISTQAEKQIKEIDKYIDRQRGRQKVGGWIIKVDGTKKNRKRC